MIGFEREHVIGPRLMDLFGDGRLGAHRVDGYGGSLQVQGVQQTRNGLDLIALFGAGDLRGAQAVFVHPGAHQMHEVSAVLGVVGAAQGLAVDGDVLAGELATPAGEDVQQGLGLEGQQDVTKHVVGGRAVLQCKKAAQPRELGLGKVLHVGEGVTVAKHGAERDHEHLIKAVEHLARLTHIVKQREA